MRKIPRQFRICVNLKTECSRSSSGPANPHPCPGRPSGVGVPAVSAGQLAVWRFAPHRMMCLSRWRESREKRDAGDFSLPSAHAKLSPGGSRQSVKGGRRPPPKAGASPLTDCRGPAPWLPALTEEAWSARESCHTPQAIESVAELVPVGREWRQIGAMKSRMALEKRCAGKSLAGSWRHSFILPFGSGYPPRHSTHAHLRHGNFPKIGGYPVASQPISAGI